MPDNLPPSRRDLLRGRVAAGDGDDPHLCSLIVHARPGRLTAVLDALRALPGVDVHGHNPIGKVIVTIEAASGDDIVVLMGRIGELDGVLSTALVFQHAATPAA